MRKQIKLFDPIIGDDELDILTKTLKSKFWADGSGSNQVKQFEEKFQKIIKSDSNVAVNSGTSALYLALSMEDIKNKEVILPSMSFVSTAHAVIANNAKPIFADIDLDTLCVDPNKIEELITKSTKIVLPVHFGGLSCDLTKIKKISNTNNLTLIEDAAHAAGSSHDGKPIGSHGKFVCFSFHPVKNLAMPTGGLISINDDNFKNITKKLQSKRWCGITNRVNGKYDVQELGWNYYMNEFSAAMGLVQLKKLKKLNKIRQQNAKRYFDELVCDKKLRFDKNCSYHFYWILVKNRDKLRKKLLEKGIETGTHYPPIHKFTMYDKKISLPNTEYAAKSIITLPTHPNLTKENMDEIIKIINKFEKN